MGSGASSNRRGDRDGASSSSTAKQKMDQPPAEAKVESREASPLNARSHMHQPDQTHGTSNGSVQDRGLALDQQGGEEGESDIEDDHIHRLYSSSPVDVPRSPYASSPSPALSSSFSPSFPSTAATGRGSSTGTNSQSGRILSMLGSIGGRSPHNQLQHPQSRLSPASGDLHSIGSTSGGAGSAGGSPAGGGSGVFGGRGRLFGGRTRSQDENPSPAARRRAAAGLRDEEDAEDEGENHAGDDDDDDDEEAHHAYRGSDGYRSRDRNRDRDRYDGGERGDYEGEGEEGEEEEEADDHQDGLLGGLTGRLDADGAAEIFMHTAMSLGMDNDDLLFNLMYFEEMEAARRRAANGEEGSDGGEGGVDSRGDVPPMQSLSSLLNSMQQETIALHSENNTPYKLKPASESAIAGLQKETFTVEMREKLMAGIDRSWIEKDASALELETECAVCKDEIEVGASIVRLPACSHYFHEECVIRWIKLQGWCPVCRAEIHPKAEETAAESHTLHRTAGEGGRSDSATPMMSQLPVLTESPSAGSAREREREKEESHADDIFDVGEGGGEAGVVDPQQGAIYRGQKSPRSTRSTTLSPRERRTRDPDLTHADADADEKESAAEMKRRQQGFGGPAGERQDSTAQVLDARAGAKEWNDNEKLYTHHREEKRFRDNRACEQKEDDEDEVKQQDAKREDKGEREDWDLSFHLLAEHAGASSRHRSIDRGEDLFEIDNAALRDYCPGATSASPVGSEKVAGKSKKLGGGDADFKSAEDKMLSSPHRNLLERDMAKHVENYDLRETISEAQSKEIFIDSRYKEETAEEEERRRMRDEFAGALTLDVSAPAAIASIHRTSDFSDSGLNSTAGLAVDAAVHRATVGPVDADTSYDEDQRKDKASSRCCPSPLLCSARGKDSEAEKRVDFELDAFVVVASTEAPHLHLQRQGVIERSEDQQEETNERGNGSSRSSRNSSSREREGVRVDGREEVGGMVLIAASAEMLSDDCAAGLKASARRASFSYCSITSPSAGVPTTDASDRFPDQSFLLPPKQYSTIAATPTAAAAAAAVPMHD